MAKRRTKRPRRPLLTTDDRLQSDESWIPAGQLPENVNYGWSDQVIICQFAPGDLRPGILLASYDFRRGKWRTSMGMGDVKNVTHWQPLPELPREYKS